MPNQLAHNSHLETLIDVTYRPELDQNSSSLHRNGVLLWWRDLTSLVTGCSNAPGPVFAQILFQQARLLTSLSMSLSFSVFQLGA